MWSQAFVLVDSTLSRKAQCVLYAERKLSCTCNAVLIMNAEKILVIADLVGIISSERWIVL
jgi:hypothetical protein